MIVAICFEFDADFLWKIPATLTIAGIAIAGVALMEFARLEPRQQWLLIAVRVSIGVAALILVSESGGRSATALSGGCLEWLPFL